MFLIFGPYIVGNKYKIPKKVIFVRFGNCCHMTTLGIDASLTFFIISNSIFLLEPNIVRGYL